MSAYPGPLRRKLTKGSVKQDLPGFFNYSPEGISHLLGAQVERGWELPPLLFLWEILCVAQGRIQDFRKAGREDERRRLEKFLAGPGACSSG